MTNSMVFHTFLEKSHPPGCCCRPRSVEMKKRKLLSVPRRESRNPGTQMREVESELDS